MKKLLLLTFSLLIVFGMSNLSAQDNITFSDDFESYTDGDKIGASSTTWRTWNNTAAADTEVTTDEAHSGINSMLLASTAANGGPADIILPFGDKYTEGNFKFSMWMYIEDGTGSYYNFQGEEKEGEQWVVQTYFKNNGIVEIQNSGNAPQGTASYPYDEWFQVSWDINLSDNNWKTYINDQLIAEFTNPVNAIASMDLYPSVQDAPNVSLAFVDDVAFEYTKPIVYVLDASVLQINAKQMTIAKSVVPVSAMIRNQGTGEITSIDITWNFDGNESTENITGLSLQKGDSKIFYAAEPVTTIAGKNTITLTVSNVNGMTDENPTNDVKEHIINAVTPAPHKGVLIEEATGTWCGWCPRGAVFMDSMENDYPLYFVGIAVHGGSASEPMLVNGYSDRISAMISGYPRIVTERNTNNDPSGVEIDLIKEIQLETVAKLDAKATMDLESRTIYATVTAEFLKDVTTQHKLGLILVENHVTGTSSNWNQVNYYAGGGRGPMGGYEKLDNPVPAKDMVYDIVGRSVFGHFDGIASFDAAQATGNKVEESFILKNVPKDWDENKFDLVAIIISPDGTVDNAIKIRDGIDFVTANNDVINNNHVHIAPNPANQVSFIHLDIAQSSEVTVIIHSMNGQNIATKNYGQLEGAQILPIEVSSFKSGMYSVSIQIGNERIMKKIIVE